MSTQPASYPYWRILLCFGLLGGAVGGLLASLLSAIVLSPNDILDFILFSPVFMLTGTGIGLIPYMGGIGGLSALILGRFTLPKIAKTPISHH